eukprot:CAMPEP_0118883852 /NCGR_PEP_ID=MMETSP1163-20130328/22841_1 /TAXON_ID=124430 /ORGANISM="Phaeomonas parva, Strain CCMP2877" /LENGTH=60 /DNA_ID=CAMNT_0006821419 /DNA_START=12 /DNA_END=194 /DNA_ORIENTATION=+
MRSLMICSFTSKSLGGAASPAFDRGRKVSSVAASAASACVLACVISAGHGCWMSQPLPPH